MFSCGLVKLISVSFHFWGIESINIDLHVWNLANLIYIAYCLVVLSISLITAFIGDVFMWFGDNLFR